MAHLDKKMIRKLVQLSRIHTTEEEEEKLLKDLSAILDYVDQLNEVDTSNVAPSNTVHDDAGNVFREDTVNVIMPREKLLMNAPDQIGGMIRVPPVLKRAN